ncbi:N-acetylglutamate synthase, mitochondrial isoform X1 [Latimeria chalumnae]|uniref:N-acetylglutamate synthase, mitochondrial isoform X1 n=1 Tax=Latimeria chalumnae TaxID=7897 RepID=UPI0003C1A2CC|nr:PREDICTED: N-acetylglutamate synthase, mitochondrial isoform X1 [Latimeria chalumnae]|eukprot:XP_005992257.1 PREDICTED: N-acetylglutamate synthase, mitochondrial isoform X1 [Latimeria chalumnae]
MAKLSNASVSCRAVTMAAQLLARPAVHSTASQHGPPSRGVRPLCALAAGGSHHWGSRAVAAGSGSPLSVYRDVRMFLNEIGGDPREAKYWLTYFQNCSTVGNKPFVVVEVDEIVLKSKVAMYSLAFGLSFLQRMNLKPIVVIGLPHDPNQSALSFSQIKATLVKNCKGFTEILQRNSIASMPFFNGGSLLRSEEASSHSSMGKVASVETDLLQWNLELGNIPIVCPIGETPSGQSVLLDSLEVTAAISKALQPLKVMFLNDSGGIQDKNKKLIGKINLPTDMDLVANAEWMCPKEHRKVKIIIDLLNHMSSESSAVITSASNVLSELFSHKGSGTLFKNAEPIWKYTSLDEIDVDRLISLINKSFGKALKEDYIDSIKHRLHSVYLSEGYNAAAIIAMAPILNGTPYLDKFVISSSKQGQGTSHMLWECMRQDLNLLFWKSRVTNRINPWYFKQCDGSFASGDWIVFWYGLSDIRDSYEMVDHAKSLPDSFYTAEIECHDPLLYEL